ncbi:MAG: GNAT family N-acetyltransferase [Candidatus Thorarchaeota archaeon]
MNFSIENATSFDEYWSAWREFMSHLSFTRDPTPSDYHVDVEQEEMSEDFKKPDRLFLNARTDEGKIVGLLDIILQETGAKFGIWQPAIKQEYFDTEVGLELIERAFSILKERGINRLIATLKFRDPSEAQWHKEFYDKIGFKPIHQEGVQLLTDLAITNNLPAGKFSGTIVNGEKFSTDEFIDLTVRAFASTPEDIALHGRHHMGDPDAVRRMHERMKSEHWGKSPADLWKIAMVDGEPAGLIIGLLRESKHKPKTGVITELGVSPEFRKRGIGYALIRSIQESFKQYECQYSFVGTPHDNAKAIRMYNKAGYFESNRVAFYELEL